MLGAIIGDIVGSKYEFDNIKTKEFTFLDDDCFFTDDTVMTIAIAKALLDCKGNYEKLSEIATKTMQKLGREYPYAGYGGHFESWLYEDNPKPYNSFGNGAAMRVSACSWVANSIEEVKELSKKVTAITHNHKEGLKGAEATAVSIYLARTGKNIKEIRNYINDNYYKMDFKLDKIRKTYDFDVTCQGSVPVAIEAFLESASFEDAIRNAISVGGDSDTIGAITGSIAEAYYSVSADIRKSIITFLDERLLKLINEFEKEYPPFIEKKN